MHGERGDLCHLVCLPAPTLSRIDRAADYGALQPLFRGTIDTDIIIEQWDQLVRLVASLKDRTAPAYVVMQRLANAPAADRLAGALTQLGRLAKTIHILRYIHEEPLRQAIQLQLNRGEFRHILAKWIFFANQGDFRSDDYEAIMNKASCLFGNPANTQSEAEPFKCNATTAASAVSNAASVLPPDADRCGCQCGGIVDTIAHHGDRPYSLQRISLT